mgnify:CR=1 FL=1
MGSIVDLLMITGAGSLWFNTGSAVVDGITNAGAFFTQGVFTAIAEVLDGIGS